MKPTERSDPAQPLAPHFDALHWRDFAAAAATALLALVVAWHAFGFSYLRADVPLTSGPWAEQSQYLIEAAREDGWFARVSRAGAPTGTHNPDAPAAGGLGLAVSGFFALFARGVGGIYNLLVLAGFGLTAALAFLVNRRLGLSPIWAALASLVFSWLPYHFEKAEQPFAMLYPCAALAAWLALEAIDARAVQNGRRALRHVILLAAIACGLSGAGYAFHALLVVGSATAVMGVRLRSWESMRRGASICGLIGALALAMYIPGAWHGIHPDSTDAGHSSNEAAALAPRFDPLRLVLPHSTHRIPALAELRASYEAARPEAGPGKSSSMGLVASLGLLVLLSVPLLGRGRDAFPAAVRASAAPVIVTLIVASAAPALLAPLDGGLLPLPDRALPFIAFFAIFAAATALERGVARRIGPSRHWLASIVAIAVLGLCLIDQIGTAGRAWQATHAARAVAHDQARQFYLDIERSAGAGAMVALLPTAPNSSDRGGAGGFSPLGAYLDSRTLVWSIGATSDSPESRWLALLRKFDPAEQFDALAALGFSGIVVDRSGLADHGVALESALADAKLRPTLQRIDAQQTFYPLNYPRSERSRAYAVVPLHGWSGIASEGEDARYESAGEASLLLANRKAIARGCFLSLSLSAASSALDVKLSEHGRILSSVRLRPGAVDEMSIYLEAAEVPRLLQMNSEVAASESASGETASRAFRLILTKPPLCR